MFGHRSGRHADGGQILVVFVLAMMAIIGIVGLAIDGGGAYAQRRDQQTAADLSALAAANDYLLSNSSDQATTRARTVAATNDFTDGSGATAVGVSIDTDNGVEVQVTIAVAAPELVPRRARHVELGRDDECDRARRVPRQRSRAGPFIFSIGAFNDDGTPKYQTSTDFGEGNGDVPISDQDMAWTNYGTGNVNTSGCPRDHRRLDDDQRDAHLRRVHRPAQQRQPHGALR